MVVVIVKVRLQIRANSLSLFCLLVMFVFTSNSIKTLDPSTDPVHWILVWGLGLLMGQVF